MRLAYPYQLMAAEGCFVTILRIVIARLGCLLRSCRFCRNNANDVDLMRCRKTSHGGLIMRWVCLSLAILTIPATGYAQEAQGPVRVSFRPPSLEDISADPQGQIIRVPTDGTAAESRPVQAAPKRSLQLGNRDDSRAESYSLENRGVETPTGKKTGRYCTDGMQRAGYPWMPGIFATWGTDPQHTVGYVGGSTPFKGPYSGVLQGECKRPTEGTFGYDYTGLHFKRNTWLLWTHGRREQGGLGRYETDGPRILPEK
jgi:hypothetical protein